MKLFLTGEPKSGKSTVLNAIIAGVQNKRGFVTLEQREAGQRIGFQLVDNQGNSEILAQTSCPTSHQVGKYYVEVNKLTHFLSNFTDVNKSQLLYIDEIGQMQLYSPVFKKLAKTFLALPNDFIATITSVYSDAFTQMILQKDDVITFALKISNREEVRTSMRNALGSRHFYNMLGKQQQLEAARLANSYIAEENYISLNKLFLNGLEYAATKQVKAFNAPTYIVHGKHGDHVVRVGAADKAVCDCKLFLGSIPYVVSRECSHIQAVALYKKRIQT